MVYAAGSIAAELQDALNIFSEILEPISGFVVQRMHQDWVERYSREQLEQELDEYLHSPTSRLLASGYWEAMVRGSFAAHVHQPPDGLVRVLQTLRRLRQVVDEIADFDDDLKAGLATTPLLFALKHGQARERLRQAVHCFWGNRDELTRASQDDHVHAIRRVTAECGGFELSAITAEAMWQEGAALCEKELGEHAAAYLLLLDLKRAKLDQLWSSNWRVTPMAPIFV